MRRIVLLFSLAVTTFLYVKPADAQCCYYYRARYFYRVHPQYHIIRPVPHYPLRWSLGLYTTGVSTDQKLGDDLVLLGGMGANLRYRGYRWGVEVAADGIGGSFADGHVKRFSVPVQISALLYLIPEGVINLYLVGGGRIVPNVIHWDYPELQEDQHFTEFGLHGGLGVDINLGRYFSLNGDLRAFGVVRNNEEPAGEFYKAVEQAVLPSNSTGLQLKLGVSFRF